MAARNERAEFPLRSTRCGDGLMRMPPRRALFLSVRRPGPMVRRRLPDPAIQVDRARKAVRAIRETLGGERQYSQWSGQMCTRTRRMNAACRRFAAININGKKEADSPGSRDRPRRRLRNGRESVRLARRPSRCTELLRTHSTRLAASYAEANDYPRAIENEKRAMTVGKGNQGRRAEVSRKRPTDFIFSSNTKPTMPSA